MSPRRVDISCYASGPALPESPGPLELEPQKTGLVEVKVTPLRPTNITTSTRQWERNPPSSSARTPVVRLACRRRGKKVEREVGSIDKPSPAPAPATGLPIIPNVVPKSNNSIARWTGQSPPRTSAAEKKIDSGEYDDAQDGKSGFSLTVLSCRGPILSCPNPKHSSLRINSQFPVPAHLGLGS
ncbi:hypothetical protein FALBO_11513 [Fusarium albosuccineum]|uniref:Uncharacterized protein n=1 Tax=Fusarium albosuccineum TaxID=1237068 RepID=A0A8H4L443_9HYPO|nr:hypothetical protein FALBO_11513 [Fusarium albosuccineum]